MTPEAVTAAADRLAAFAHRTPVVTSRTLDAHVGASVVCKAENLQRAGAFKFRGATNALLAAGDEAVERGVATFSSGNHAQALALAGSLLGVEVTVVMPHDAPQVKRDATEDYGARVVGYDRDREDREEVAARLTADTGTLLVPPFDHPAVIAGQGTAALELVEDAGPLDVLVVPVGGGGLIAGCATALAAVGPTTRIIGVEPATRSVGRRSLAEGRRQVDAQVAATIADGQRSTSLGELTFPIIRDAVEAVVGVDDAAIADTVRWVLARMKLVVEPSGASALAALRAGLVADVADRRVGVILSGGNVAPDVLAGLLSGG